MIKKTVGYILRKLLFLIPENWLIRYVRGIFDKKDTSFLTVIMRNHLSERYKKADEEQKKKLGLLIWRSPAAVRYFKERTFPDQIVVRFENIIKRNRESEVCEIGTGNGRLINYLISKIT